jgi:Amidohydrolase
MYRYVSQLRRSVLERADFVYERHSIWTGTDLEGTMPSGLFREKFVSCFIFESQGLAARDYIGIDGITYECDYPHSDTMWPTAPERLMEDFVKAGCSDEEINKISQGNAIRILGFDPIAILGGRDKCTVGALRAQVRDLDLGVNLHGGTRLERRQGKPITAADFAKMFPWAAQVKPGSGNRMAQYLRGRQA